MGTTPIYAIPYVDPGSTVATFPAADKAQAEAVENYVPAWCDLVANAVQSMANATEVPINLNAGSQSPAGWWTSGALVKIPFAGLYQVILTFSFAGNATGSRIVLLKHNGATARSWNVAGAGTPANLTGSVMLLRRFAKDDTAAIYQYQSSTAALNTFSQAYPGIALSRLGG